MIANHRGEIPVVLLLLPFLLGLWMGIDWLSDANQNFLIIVFLVLALIFITLNFGYNRLSVYKNRWLGGLLIVLILFTSGWLSVTRYKELNNRNHFSKAICQYFVVKISDEPVFKNNLLRFTADVEEGISNGKKTVLSGTLLVAIKDSGAKQLYYGDELLVPAKYNPVEPSYVPAAFNYKNYLANQNIYYQSFFTPKQYVLLNKNTGNPLIAYSLRLRQRLVEKLKNNMRDTDAVSVASTLILGYKADLSNDVLQAYSKTGTIHVLSVSGAHVAIIYVLLNLAFGFLNRFKYGKLLKAGVIITIIWYYSLLSGFSPAVCRAAVMISMVIIGKTFNRYINTLNILAISAFLLLIYDPFFITDVGFQLSYLAVAGLIIFQPMVYKWFKFKHSWADKLWALCSVSIAAQVITFPLSAFYFHQFPVYFLISNLFIIIPSAVIMYSGILFLLLPQIPVVSLSIAFVLEKSIIIMNKGLAIIEHTPFASFGKIWLTVPGYLLLYAIIIGCFYFLYDKKVLIIKFVLVCSLVLCLSVTVKSIKTSRSNAIAWLNLKKHQGIVFKNANKAIVLTDLKPDDKVFQYSIQPYLDSCQISDAKIMTLNQDVNTTWLIKKSNFVQFLDKRILIFNGKAENYFAYPNLKTDFLYLTANPKNQFLQEHDNPGNEVLILDGSNTDNFINRARQETIANHTILRITKNSNSVISLCN